jgi:chromate transporter
VNELLDVLAVFARLGVVAFGGGIGILPEMERQVVAGHGWVSHQEFVDAFALAQVTPGPGMLMVVMIGYRAAGPLGALVAAAGMFGPAAFLTWLVADRWTRLGERPAVVLVRRALAPVALGLLAAGCYTLLRLSVDGPGTALIAAAALAAVAILKRSPALTVAVGAAVGLVFFR